MTELAFPKELLFTKTGESKECDICHYWYFLDKCFNPTQYGVFFMHNSTKRTCRILQDY